MISSDQPTKRNITRTKSGTYYSQMRGNNMPFQRSILFMASCLFGVSCIGKSTVMGPPDQTSLTPRLTDTEHGIEIFLQSEPNPNIQVNCILHRIVYMGDYAEIPVSISLHATKDTIIPTNIPLFVGSLPRDEESTNGSQIAIFYGIPHIVRGNIASPNHGAIFFQKENYRVIRTGESADASGKIIVEDLEQQSWMRSLSFQTDISEFQPVSCAVSFWEIPDGGFDAWVVNLSKIKYSHTQPVSVRVR